MKKPETRTRIGNQIPTLAFVLPYDKTFGADAIKLYEKTGRKAQDWQKLLVFDLLAYNNEKLWVHTKFGYSVPRRNGKNEIVSIRELWGLQNGEEILHTAHRAVTSHEAWERLLDYCEKAELPIARSYKALGKEEIEIENGGRIHFSTRTANGGLGLGVDLLIIDEAQEYQDDQETALKYIVTSSKNPQTVFCGTPPTMVSAGTIFPKMRANILAGGAENSAWEEWSVDFESDPHDVEKWYLTNPSLGTVVTERSIADEIGDNVIDFNIQRLGLWVQYNQKSAISKREWADLCVGVIPKLTGEMFIGIKYAHDGESVSMAVAVHTQDAKIFVEAIDCRPIRAGTAWLVDFLTKTELATRRVVVDGANGQNLLAAAMKENKLHSPLLPAVKDIIAANASFEQAIFAGTLCHMAQPGLAQAVENCEKRAIGSNGGFGYRSIRNGVDVSLLDAAILAYWAADKCGAKKPVQKASY